jgi:hypothetical protein
VIYELREYVTVPGRMPALQARFANHTMALFQRHGLEVYGFWHDPKDENRLVYMLRFADEQALKSAWSAFQNDPDWQKARADSEKDGKIVTEIHSRILQPAPYWK